MQWKGFLYALLFIHLFSFDFLNGLKERSYLIEVWIKAKWEADLLQQYYSI